MDFVDRDGGYWVSRTSSFEANYGIFGRECSFDFCAEGVRVTVVGQDSDISVPYADQVASIRGNTLKALKASWSKRFPGGSVTDVLVDGRRGFVGEEVQGGTWAFVPFDNRWYALGAYRLWGGSRGTLDQFLSGFHFLMPECWLLPCPDGSKPGADGAAIARFDALRANGTLTSVASGMAGVIDDTTSLRGWTYQCKGYCRGELRMAIGTTRTGALVDPGGLDTSYRLTLAPPYTRIKGASLDDLERDWLAQLGRGTFERTTLDGVPATKVLQGGVLTVLAIWRGYVIAISSVGMKAFDPYPEGPYVAFMSGFSFIR